MSRRTRVYVSGPITSSGDWKENHKELTRAGMALRTAGYAPFVPGVGLASAMGKLTHEEWMECDRPYVEISDAVLRLPGPSTGADLEEELAKEIGIPVYYSIEELVANEDPQRHGDARFHRILQSLGRLHDLKQADYGTDADPFANVRASRRFGVAPWLSALVRMNDKMTRLSNFATGRNLSNESAEDSFLDIAVYSLIALILLKEEE